jgi:hypothetical protein
MKTTIIQLEPHDDIISARDKMTWGQSSRILLVWPKRGKILRRRVDLVLLQRQGVHLGAQVALVTKDQIVNDFADEIGIPVFRSSKEAQKYVWDSPKENIRSMRPPGQKHPGLKDLRMTGDLLHQSPRRRSDQIGWRLTFFSLGVLSVLALALFFFPSAKVVLTPVLKEQEIDLDVRANWGLPAPNPSGGIPAYSTTVMVEGQKESPATGSVSSPDGYAAGTVRLTNLTDKPVEVPLGTALRTLTDPQIRFITQAYLRVPAGPGKEAEVEVRAVLPGSSGNIEADQIRAVEGDIGLRLSGTNPQPLVGGEERSVRSPTSEDYQQLRNDLLDRMQTMALANLEQKKSPDQKILPASIQIQQILEEIVDPPVGQPGDQIRMKLRAEYSAVYVNGKDMKIVSQTGLDANIPTGYQPVPDSLTTIDLQEPAKHENGIIEWKIRAVRKIQASAPRGQVIAAVLGHTPSEAVRSIKGFLPLQKDPEITLYPSWWPILPYLPFRLEVITP